MINIIYREDKRMVTLAILAYENSPIIASTIDAMDAANRIHKKISCLTLLGT